MTGSQAKVFDGIPENLEGRPGYQGMIKDPTNYVSEQTADYATMN
jgi:hypothetical protein